MSISNPPTEILPPESDIRALGQAFVMIIVSEVGDKTFLIAAILAMRHDRFIVFAGAFGSLVVMSILSAAMGHLLPTLIPKSWTQAAAAVLFLVFGIRMLLEAREMKSGNEKIQEEMREVQEEIELEAAEIDGIHVNGRAAAPEAMEEGVERKPAPKGIASDLREGVRNFCSLLFGPTFVQAFILTFLGEWGDRSQIATIALAAAHNMYVVAFGTIVGHGLCTAVAVIGGRYLSTKISVKHVTLGGAVLFLLFAVIYLYEAFYDDSIDPSLLPS